MPATSKITLAPTYELHREAVDAADTTITDSRRGVNCGGYSRLHVQIVPDGTANPTVEVLFWSDGAGAFIPAHTPLVFAGVGADKAYEFSIDVEGRRIFVAVTTIAAGSVDIYVAGWHAHGN